MGSFSILQSVQFIIVCVTAVKRNVTVLNVYEECEEPVQSFLYIMSHLNKNQQKQKHRESEERPLAGHLHLHSDNCCEIQCENTIQSQVHVKTGGHILSFASHVTCAFKDVTVCHICQAAQLQHSLGCLELGVVQSGHLPLCLFSWYSLHKHLSRSLELVQSRFYIFVFLLADAIISTW
jgi:hypothetical protein